LLTPSAFRSAVQRAYPASSGRPPNARRQQQATRNGGIEHDARSEGASTVCCTTMLCTALTQFALLPFRCATR